MRPYRFTIEPDNDMLSYGLRQLRYFLAVGEEQHYGRQRSACAWLSPPFRQIKNLEEEIGFKLFERLPRE